MPSFVEQETVYNIVTFAGQISCLAELNMDKV